MGTGQEWRALPEDGKVDQIQHLQLTFALVPVRQVLLRMLGGVPVRQALLNVLGGKYVTNALQARYKGVAAKVASLSRLSTT